MSLNDAIVRPLSIIKASQTPAPLDSQGPAPSWGACDACGYPRLVTWRQGPWLRWGENPYTMCSHHQGTLIVTRGNDAPPAYLDPHTRSLALAPSPVFDAGVCLWELIAIFRPIVRKAFIDIERTWASDLPKGATCIDELTIETLVDNLILGEDSKPSPLVTFITDVLNVSHVDPGAWLLTRIRREVRNRFCIAVDDPHVGRKIRKLARDTGVTSPEELTPLAQERWPYDHIGLPRVIRALQWTKRPSATPLPLGAWL